VFPDSVRAKTKSVETPPGFQPVVTPVAASTAPMLLRGWPPRVENSPPTYTTPPPAARVRTTLLLPETPGFQDEPTVRDMGQRLRGTPFTWVKLPPRYQPPAPSGATAKTDPLARGRGVSTSPLA
jgi:hypothetical protein